MRGEASGSAAHSFQTFFYLSIRQRLMIASCTFGMKIGYGIEVMEIVFHYSSVLCLVVRDVTNLSMLLLPLERRGQQFMHMRGEW